MTPVQILYAVIHSLLLVVPFGVAYWIRKRTTSVLGFILIVGVSSVLMSSVVITQWLGYDLYLDHKVEMLDRNGDGFWSAEETLTWSISEQRYVDSYIGDGGRNVFAVIIFPVFSLVYSLLASLLYLLVAWLLSRRRNV
jgi:hypothetical protein